MSCKAVFLDKDGTLIEDIPYNVDPDRIQLSLEVTQALQKLHQAGYLLIVITNQAGVAHQFFSESALDAVEQRLHHLFKQVGVALSGFYYCPHHPDGIVKQYAIACDCRKPQPGLLLRAAHDHDIDLTQSWFVGDILHDVEAGRAANCQTILLNNGNETEWKLSPTRLPHHLVSNLAEAAEVILAVDQPPANARPGFYHTPNSAENIASQFIDSWQSFKVLVIGDVMLDCYLHGKADRLCQEAPVPVVAIAEQVDFPGGAANVAANVSRLGVNPFLLSVVGQDESYDHLQAALKQHSIQTEGLVVTTERSTLVKQRVVANSHLLLRLDQGSTAVLSQETETKLICSLFDLVPVCDAIIISDYGYGVMTPKIIQTLADLQKDYQKTLVVDAKKLSLYQFIGASAVKPNYLETLQLLQLPQQAGDRVAQLLPHQDKLLHLTGANRVAVTLDRDGVLMVEKNHSPFHLPTLPAPTHHTSGAGDTFVSTLTLALAADAPTLTAAQLATAAAAIVVTQPGTTTCTAHELRRKVDPSLCGK
jgi:D-beta-D-heptose 7-phosphate kinase/D-beta-D-heptose 1-phosphate adenosyltransferase